MINLLFLYSFYNFISSNFFLEQPLCRVHKWSYFKWLWKCTWCNWTLLVFSQVCPMSVSPFVDPCKPGHEIWEEFSKSFIPAVREVVEFAKWIPGFQDLSQHDQVNLLKAGTFEVKQHESRRVSDSASVRQTPNALLRFLHAGADGALRVVVRCERADREVPERQEVQRGPAALHGRRRAAQLHVWVQREAHRPAAQRGRDETLLRRGAGVCRYALQKHRNTNNKNDKPIQNINKYYNSIQLILKITLLGYKRYCYLVSSPVVYCLYGKLSSKAASKLKPINQ